MDLLAPAWDLLINGRSLPPAYRALVSSVEVDATGDGADELVVNVTVRDPVSGAWRFVGETMLGPGTEVVVLLGYGRDLVPVQSFTMVREETSYSSGAPTATLRAYSAEARMGVRMAPISIAGPVTVGEVLRRLAEASGITYRPDLVDQPARQLSAGFAKEKGKSDLVALQELATLSGLPAAGVHVRYDAASRRDVLHFRAPNVRRQERVARFVWDARGSGASTLRSFNPTLDLAGVPTRVEVSGWDPESQAPFVVIGEVTGGRQEPTVLRGAAASGYGVTSGSKIRANALGADADGATEALSVPHLRTAEDALSFARGWIETRNLAFLTARATTIGTPHVWAGDIIQIGGVAPVHEGLWLVDHVKHVVGTGGYTLDMDLSRVVQERSTAKTTR